MKIALIDHFDSFTFNVVELIRKITGSFPHVIKTDSVILNELHQFDKIILSPGPGLPSDFVNIKKILEAYYATKPILGICLGHQAIAHFFGSKLINLPHVVHGQPKRIVTQNNSILFNKIPNSFIVGLYHSWVVDLKDFSTDLQVTALSEDKQIMALQHKNLPIFGVQFHPESFFSEHGEKIMQNFLNM